MALCAGCCVVKGLGVVCWVLRGGEPRCCVVVGLKRELRLKRELSAAGADPDVP